MSEKNNIDEFDLMMKSILDEAREEVPERVWEGVSVGLDKAARRKTVVLWWRRAAVGAAAAAAVVSGVFLTHNNDDEFVPAAADKDMIAVVEPEDTVVEPGEIDVISDEVDTYTLLAEAKEVIVTKDENVREEENVTVPESADDAIEMAEKTDDTKETSPMTGNESGEAAEYFPEDWGEEDKDGNRGITFVLSGIAGTNNALSQNKTGPMMSPPISQAPRETGIEETSVKSSYGIPLSFGAGLKFDLSDRWSIGAGLNYTYLSRQFYGKYTKVSDAGQIESTLSSDISNRQHYIGIPVNVFYDVISNDKISFYAYAGGTVEKCLSDAYHVQNTPIVHKMKTKGVQLSANAGIGVEFAMGEHLGLYIDPSVRYYFQNDQPKSIRTVQPLMLGFEMGLRARL